MDQPKAITLQELNLQIKSGVKDLFPKPFWIIAEISEMNTNQSGHCYLELIEKAADSEQISSKAKATIWAFTFRMLKPYFESVTGQRFTAGLKVMLSVTVEFHELYGFSLNVKDIEPNFTVGDLTRKKLEIIRQLQNEGVFHLNKELEFAMVPQNIAVISSKTAAGYGDFIDQLTKNRYGYRYHIKLYKAFMQGADTEKSIITALEHIFDSGIAYDAVIIIRGGGSQSDLNYFNSYWLAYHITQFPIPVITGIGHDRDETITDLVAHTSLKTPTAVAEFIIEKTVEFDNYLSDLYESFSDHVTNKLHDFNEYLKDIENSYISTVKLIVSNKQRALEKNKAIADLTIKSILKNRAQKIKSVTQRIKPQIHYLINIQEKEISNIKKKYKSLSRKAMLYKKHQIDEYENRAHLLDPMQLLKKGYSLTFNNGVLIKSTKQLKPGDILISKWFDGNAESSIQKISPD